MTAQPNEPVLACNVHAIPTDRRAAHQGVDVNAFLIGEGFTTLNEPSV